MGLTATAKRGANLKSKGRAAVGIDPSRTALQVSLLFPRAGKPRNKTLPLGPAAVKRLEELLRGVPATIAMEGSHSTGQLFLLEVLKQGHDVREVHPFVSKRFREALSEDHTDRKDAEGLAVLARWKADLPPVRFAEAQATYKRISRLRQRLVRDHARYLNRVHAVLSETYGVTYKGLFKNLASKKALRFFQQYPTINDALRGDPDAPLQVGPQAWERLRRAGSWWETTYLRCLRTEVRTLAAHVLALHDRIAEVGREMAKAPRTRNLETLLSLPRLGVATAMTIVGNSGDFSRFGGNVDRYVAYAGLAPASHQSGAGEPSGRPRCRYNRYLKNAFMFMAFNRLQVDQRAREYYQRKRQEGKEHWTALRALARYLCRWVFRILTGKTPTQQGGAAPTNPHP